MGLLARFKRNDKGAAAVEMALVATAIAGLAFTSFDLWQTAMRHQNMDGAVEASAQYYLNGGQSDADARTLGLSAWRDKPPNGDIQVSRACSCNGASATCGALCTSTSTPPNVYVVISASASDDAAIFQKSQARQETVRVR